MSIDTLKRLGWFAAFLLAQVTVLGRVHLFGWATPLLYVYFILQFPRNYPKWALLLWAFAMGLAVDIFANTPGVAAASLTLVAAICPYYLELFVSHDAAEDLRPALRTIGLTKYTWFVVPMVLLYCAVFYTLEMFTFFNAMYWMACVAGSAGLTLALMFTFETAKGK